jgi:hypothetical protein
MRTPFIRVVLSAAFALSWSIGFSTTAHAVVSGSNLGANATVLDIHKGLYFICTLQNIAWGYDLDELYIEVLEYPTPEPTTLVLAAAGAALLLIARVRSRRRRSDWPSERNHCVPITILPSLICIAALALACKPALAQPIVAGGNFSVPLTFRDVPYQSGAVNYEVNERIILDPSAAPIIKRFASPSDQSGPILLTAGQSPPLVIAENFSLLTDGPPTPKRVTDWHEGLLTKGWLWVLPGDPNFPELFPQGQTLITRDGEPWASNVLPGTNPLLLNIVFDPIEPGHILDVHKALLWVGNGEDTIWGDEPEEDVIEIAEYPTPEPGTMVLAALGAGVAGLAWRRSRRVARPPRQGSVGGIARAAALGRC